MALLQRPSSTSQTRRTGFEGGLARTLVRTLLIFTFIPLTLMAGAGYLRARDILQQQVVAQMQSQLQSQLAKVDLSVKTKEIRLDRVAHSPNRIAQLQSVLAQGSANTDFATLRQELSADLRTVNPEVGRSTFNEFFIADPNGVVRMASNPSWEGTSLKDSALYANLAGKDHESYMLFDAAPLYPGQLVLATVSQLHAPDGTKMGSIVGITESQEWLGVLQNLSALNTQSEALFVTESGKLIGTDPYTSQVAVISLPETPTLLLKSALDRMMNKPEGTPESVQFTDQGGAAAFGQVVWLASMHVGIVYEIHQATIFGPLNSLVPFTAGVFLVSLLAMGIVISLGAQRVFRPLARLTEITHRFAAGDFNQRAEAQSRDEIGMLAESFNHMAEELGELYRSLEQKVEERTRQIRIAAELAQRITSTTKLDDLLNRTVQLLVDQFNFYEASIFMLDRGGRIAVLRASYGPAAKEMLARGHRLESGSSSIIGWVTANNQPRVASDVADDPIHFRNELLPETRSEAGIPISVGNLVLGALDVQSREPGAFGPDTTLTLQLIASQIAVAIQNVGLVESTQVNLQELERLQRAGHLVASGKDKGEVLGNAAQILENAPYPATLISLSDGHLKLETVGEVNRAEAARVSAALHNLEPSLRDLPRYLANGSVVVEAGAQAIPITNPLRTNTAPNVRGPEATSPNAPLPLVQFVRQLNYQSAAFLPIFNSGQLAALIIIGGQKETLSNVAIQPYTNIAELAGITLDRISEAEAKQKQLAERQALTAVNQAIVESSSEFSEFFKELHSQVQRIVGDYAFLVALYDKSTQSISIPYMYEEGRTEKIEAFPLGEGLSSILIRTGKPLMLVEDVERRGAQLGARSQGRPAKSWMGAPMMIQNEPIGALILQDLDHERAFTEDNLNFFMALANQVASVIHNAYLLEESRARAVQLETAAEIARDISGSLNLDELLAKAVAFVRERFDFYHAAIFLLDASGENALVREATGEAGAQMKRIGHKLGVGSKSIVGYVAGRGEPLVVNDTAKDATYYANPLLSNTRSEAALPLKVGERIVGVMDVQSAHPYAFGSDNLRTLRILADQLGVAVVNSELFAETQEHLSQHRLLHHITTSAASGTTLEEALESAVTGLQVTLGGDRVAILLMDREKAVLEVKAAAGYSEDILNLRIPLGTGVTGWAALHKRPLRVDDVAADPRYIQGSSNTRSELAIPLLYRNDTLGVLNVESEQTSAYTENDEEMLGTLGGSLAAVIANARLLEQIRAQAERERAVFEITSKIRRSANMQAILSTTASELTKAVGARRAQIRIGIPAQEPTDQVNAISEPSELPDQKDNEP